MIRQQNKDLGFGQNSYKIKKKYIQPWLFHSISPTMQCIHCLIFHQFFSDNWLRITLDTLLISATRLYPLLISFNSGHYRCCSELASSKCGPRRDTYCCWTTDASLVSPVNVFHHLSLPRLGRCHPHLHLSSINYFLISWTLVRLRRQHLSSPHTSWHIVIDEKKIFFKPNNIQFKQMKYLRLGMFLSKLNKLYENSRRISINKVPSYN